MFPVLPPREENRGPLVAASYLSRPKDIIPWVTFRTGLGIFLIGGIFFLLGIVGLLWLDLYRLQREDPGFFQALAIVFFVFLSGGGFLVLTGMVLSVFLPRSHAKGFAVGMLLFLISEGGFLFLFNLGINQNLMVHHRNEQARREVWEHHWKNLDPWKPIPMGRMDIEEEKFPWDPKELETLFYFGVGCFLVGVHLFTGVLLAVSIQCSFPYLRNNLFLFLLITFSVEVLAGVVYFFVQKKGNFISFTIDPVHWSMIQWSIFFILSCCAGWFLVLVHLIRKRISQEIFKQIYLLEGDRHE